MNEEEILKKLESGAPLSDEELDFAINGPKGQATPPAPRAGAGAPVPGVANWEVERGKVEPVPQPSLMDILQQGSVGAGGRLLSYYKGLFGSDAERGEHGENIRRMREELPYSGLGEGVADMAVTAPLPLMKGSMLGRSLKTGAAMAPVAAVASRGTGAGGVEMATDAALGFAGGAIGTPLSDVVTKAINAVRGKWSDPAKKYLYDYNKGRIRAGEPGVDLSVGDLFPKTPARWLEDMGEAHPLLSHRSDVIEKQGDQLTSMMFDKRGNKFVNAVRDTKALIDQENRSLWQPLYAAAQGAPGIPPYGIKQALQAMDDDTVKYLMSSSDENTRAILEKILTSKKHMIPPSLTFRELRDVQQAVGPLLADPGLDQAAKTATSQLKRLSAAAHGDLTRWGSDPKTKPIYELYKQVNEEYKKSFLPFYENWLVTRAQRGDYDQRPEKLISDLLSGQNKTQRENLLWYLSKGSHEGTGLVETIKAADRAATKLTQKPGKANVAPRSLFSTITAPASAATKAPGLVPFVGASEQLGPEALQAGMRGGLGLLAERKSRVQGTQ